ncbi:hypothetical protein L218DRAFT_1076342 [Marasmius fiardii PR-910]|nr:hypothetical protein L218DRAFT_1076342 [Marasmius fiardii PR-910]
MLSADQVEQLKPSLEGVEAARIVSIAFFTLSVYEVVIFLDSLGQPKLTEYFDTVVVNHFGPRAPSITKVKYFWSGKWTTSRILFFLNRYVPIMIMTFAFFALELPNPSEKPNIHDFLLLQFCLLSIQSSMFLNILAIGIIQAMLVYRVWHLFGNDRCVQWGIVGAFTCSIFFSLFFTIIVLADLKILVVFRLPNSPGCRAARPPMYWRIYLPSLVLHSILYILTAIRALRNRQIFKEAPILKRLLRDGGLFLFVVFASVGFTSVGAFLKDSVQINVVVFFSNYLLATTSIAMSRVMFSLHSLASHLGSDAGWLLNNVELRRTDWRRGSREGEIIIDRWTDEDESIYETERSESKLQMSRIGIYGDLPWDHVQKHNDVKACECISL